MTVGKSQEDDQTYLKILGKGYENADFWNFLRKSLKQLWKIYTRKLWNAKLSVKNYTQPFSGLLSTSTWVSQYQKKHSPTRTHPDHQTFFINFLHLLRSVASSLFNFSPGPLWSSLVWDLLLNTSCISSPNHLLFAAHAHTTACFAVVPMLCCLFVISLSAPYLEICFLP